MLLRMQVPARLAAALALGQVAMEAQQLRSEDNQPNNVYIGAGRTSGAYAFYSRTVGKVVLGASYLDNRNEGYREYQVGAGLDLDKGSYGAWPFLGISRAAETWYVQPWTYTWWEKGRFVSYGYVGVYFPVQSAGVFQLFVDSATALFKVTERFGVGAAYGLTFTAGAAARHAAGPAVQLEAWKTTTTVEFLKSLGQPGDEVRVTFQRSF